MQFDTTAAGEDRPAWRVAVTVAGELAEASDELGPLSDLEERLRRRWRGVPRKVDVRAVLFPLEDLEAAA